MNKNKKIILQNILILITIATSTAYIILSRNLGDLDEIWNYNFANCVAKGLVPYKNFNIVITPLLPIIEGIILKITCNELIIMRILAIILSTLILFLIYKNLEKLKINKSISLLTTLLIGYLVKNYICIDYNWFVLFLCLLIIYIHNSFNIKENSYNWKIEFIIGFLAGLCILTKQTTGVFICIAIITYRIVICIINKNKTIKQIIPTLAGMLIPVIIFLIYLSITNSFISFIDYCLLGIKTFRK